ANTFTVGGPSDNWSGIANLDGKGGSNTYNITLTGSGTGIVNIANTGATAADVNTLNATVQPPSSLTNIPPTFVTSTTVKFGTQTVNYTASGINVVNVIGGKGGLTFDVQSTNSTVSTTTIRTTGNANVINVSSTAGVLPVKGGVVNTIQGALSLVGNGHDTANVDDSGDMVGQTGLLTSTQLTGLGMGSQGVTYSGLAQLNIKLGSASDTFNVRSTSPTTTLNTGAGTNTVNV